MDRLNLLPKETFTLVFDPKDGKSAMSLTLDGVLPVLKERKDIENHEEVIADFIKQAQEMIRRFEQDGYIYTGKRYMGGVENEAPDSRNSH